MRQPLSSLQIQPSATASGTGGHGGSRACDAIIKCLPGEVCGYDLLAGCNAKPICRKLRGCIAEPAAHGCRCSDSARIVSDCNTGCYECPAPACGQCTDLFDVPVFNGAATVCPK